MALQAIHEFDFWTAGYPGAQVTIYRAGTTRLATLYEDPGGEVQVGNPQVLLSLESKGVHYGRWATETGNLYTPDTVELDINGTRSGRQIPPLISLSDQDVSNSVSKVRLGTYYRRLQDIFADQIVAASYGEIGSSPQTNTTTIETAISKAASQGDGGGEVLLPPGIIEVTQLVLGRGVVLRGQGIGVTTLMSKIQDTIITLEGDRAGLRDLTLDGNDIQNNSLGVFGSGLKEVEIAGVKLQNLQTAAEFKGLESCEWLHLDIFNCSRGIRFLGDKNEQPGGQLEGGEVRNITWIGGHIEQIGQEALELKYVDRAIEYLALQDVEFNECTTAIQVESARFIDILQTRIRNTTDDLKLFDSTETGAPTTSHIRLSGRLDTGRLNFDGECTDVVVLDSDLIGVEINLTLPKNDVVLRDCREDLQTTIIGTDTTKLIRDFTSYRGSTIGQTTGGAATKAWAVQPRPGEQVSVKAIVFGNQRDGVNRARFIIEMTGFRAPATLNYDNQTADFTLGQRVTGSVSGASGLIVADNDSGTSGDLRLRNVLEGPLGSFQNNETLTDSSGGTARCVGVLNNPGCTVDAIVSHQAIKDQVEFNVTFTANGSEIELQVTGKAAMIMDWTAHIDMVRNG